MWQSEIATPFYLAGSFDTFVESEKYYELAQVASTDLPQSDNSPGCLLDIIEMWVVHGNATQVCPTFEVFLLVVIEIVDSWQHNDASKRLWPDRDGLKSQPVQRLSQPDPEDESGRTSLSATDHPVLRRENFLLQQAVLT
jgi:hypothetical protein